MTNSEIAIIFTCVFCGLSSIFVDYFTHSKLHKRVEKLEADVKSLFKGESDVR